MKYNIIMITISALYSGFSIYRIKNNSMTAQGWFYFIMFAIVGIICVVLSFLGINGEEFFNV